MAKIPPSSDMIEVTATAVARRVCGALFVSHAINAGATQVVPVTEKKRDA